ncbi:Fc.00g105600.m01.CDS01 [Cosmosporella sp. VM-42]
MASRISLFLFFLHSLLSAFSSSAFASAINPVPPIKDIETEDAISTPLTDGCPQPCQLVGSDPSKWTQIHSQDELSGCDQPLLFNLNVQNPPSEFATMQVCSSESTTSTTPTRRDQLSPVEPRAAEESVSISENCGAGTATITTSISFGRTGVIAAGNDAAAAAELLAQYLDDGASCGTTIMFAKSGTTIVGLYVGAEVQKQSASNLVRQSSVDTVNRLGKDTEMLQICQSNNIRAESVGVFAVNSVENLPQAQSALKAWSNGKCVESQEGAKEDFELDILSANKVKTRGIELRSRLFGVDSFLTPRAECKTTEVKSGDSCASLAKRCGITSANFNKYNPKANFCSTLMPKQLVCCSAGTLPDKSPQPQKDGTCFTYSIKSGDSCYSIAQAYLITEDTIRNANRNVWGWSGCSRLQFGQRICLSKGTAPMPMPVTGAVCGPQKPGSVKPTGTKTGWDLAKMNPCPLKACCSGFGFCGTTGEFCTNTTGTGSAPGTYKVGTSGCVQNCGTSIVGNTNKPAKFLSVGYFQSYNVGRPCLNMDVTKLATIKTVYTHMHFAFAGLTTSFTVNMQGDVSTQFTKFVAMKGSWKKIISFGGWAESTDAATFQRYRDAINPTNREKFASNVLAFLNKYKLDGVDFDWEYPGASNTAGSAGSNTDAANYLQFLTLMRKKLGTSGKTMSVALPAAYWYLKPFPVDKMAPLVDYMVYMTYDLHGQWDYGNQYASPGCPNGNCLRSHVNKTETHNALSMITKAGVPASKIVVGVSSYGRSFKMKDPKCTGPTCQFTGSFSVSEAEPGVCTGSAGYLANAEISKIIADSKAGKTGVTAKTWHDTSSDSDLLVWGTLGKGNTNWVAYMTEDTKKKRADWYKSLNFGGTINWAIDLQTWFSPQPQ